MSSTDPFDGPPRRPKFDPAAYAAPPQAGWGGQTLRYVLILIAVGLGSRAAWTVWQHRQKLLPQDDSGEAQVPFSDLRGDTLVEPTSALEPSTLPTQPATVDRRAELDLAKAAQRDLLGQAAELRQHLDSWQDELRKWQTDVETLLDGAKGNSLAADAQAVKSFRVVYNQSRPEPARIEAIRQLLADIPRTVQTAIADPRDAYHPEPSARDRLTTLIEEARAGTATYRQARLQIAAILDTAKPQSALSDTRLKDAIAQQERIERIASIEAARERMEAAQQAADAKIATAKEEAVRIAGEVEARKILDAAAAAKSQQETDEANRQAQQAAEQERRENDLAKQQRLNALERDMGDVRTYLAPFIAKGYAQPSGYDNTQSASLAPMSLSKLTAAGALKDSGAAMEQLMRYATVANDRDKGGFPQYFGGERGWQQANKEFIRRAQELLNQYGDLLVEQGLLSP